VVALGVKILTKNRPIAASALLIELSALVMADVLPVVEACAMAEVAAFNCPVRTEISPARVEELIVFKGMSGGAAFVGC